jgi:hypothetical protein
LTLEPTTNHSRDASQGIEYEDLLKCNKACYLSKDMSSDRRENPEQIPSSHNEGQTEAMVSEQARIEGERKEVDVKDYPKAAAIAQVLKDLEFPAAKKQILDYVERARPQSEEILSDIQKIEDKQYQNVSDVTKAAGLVKQ